MKNMFLQILVQILRSKLVIFLKKNEKRSFQSLIYLKKFYERSVKENKKLSGNSEVELSIKRFKND